MLLDMNENTYVNQLFGENSYFQDGFTYLVSLVFILSGIAYGFGSKTIKNDKEIIENASKKFSGLGSIIILIFVMAQFIAIFRKSNIGMIVATWLANLLGYMNISGIPLIVVSLILIALANFLLTSPSSKWMIFSPIMVPMFMQSNISPQFAQIVLRAGDSMTKGFTPFLASFVIYIGYLNMYNLYKEKPYSIRKSLSMIAPYFGIISLTWILLVVGWYLIGIPIGPGVFPTI
jgi:aminobenzoyl-glutamate transport protein